jgi:hypothetical protein
VGLAAATTGGSLQYFFKELTRHWSDTTTSDPEVHYAASVIRAMLPGMELKDAAIDIVNSRAAINTKLSMNCGRFKKV